MPRVRSFQHVPKSATQISQSQAIKELAGDFSCVNVVCAKVNVCWASLSTSAWSQTRWGARSTSRTPIRGTVLYPPRNSLHRATNHWLPPAAALRPPGCDSGILTAKTRRARRKARQPLRSCGISEGAGFPNDTNDAAEAGYRLTRRTGYFVANGPILAEKYVEGFGFGTLPSWQAPTRSSRRGWQQIANARE